MPKAHTRKAIHLLLALPVVFSPFLLNAFPSQKNDPPNKTRIYRDNNHQDKFNLSSQIKLHYHKPNLGSHYKSQKTKELEEQKDKQQYWREKTLMFSPLSEFQKTLVPNNEKHHIDYSNLPPHLTEIYRQEYKLPQSSEAKDNQRIYILKIGCHS